MQIVIMRTLVTTLGEVSETLTLDHMPRVTPSEDPVPRWPGPHELMASPTIERNGRKYRFKQWEETGTRTRIIGYDWHTKTLIKGHCTIWAIYEPCPSKGRC